MDARTVERVSEARAPGAGTERVVGAVHDVVREQLRTPLEKLAKGLFAALGIELVLLLDRHPRKLPPLFRDLPRALGVFGLELRELVTCRLPLLARSSCMRRHRLLLRRHIIRVARPQR